MADITKPELPDWRKFLFQCDANDAHFILFDWWEEAGDDDFPGTLSVEPTVWAPGIRKRIGAAVRILLGRRQLIDCVLVTEAEGRRMRDALDLFLKNETMKKKRREQGQKAAEEFIKALEARQVRSDARIS